MDNTKQRLIPWRWSESNKRSLKKKKDGTENFISFNLDPETGEDLLHNLKPSASMRGQKKKKENAHKCQIPITESDE